MAVIRIAQFQRPLRHSVKAQQQPLRLEFERSKLAFNARLQCIDVQRVVVIRRERAERRLAAHRRQFPEDCVGRTCRRCCAILRIERRRENALATQRHKIVDRLADTRIAVAHCEIDDHVVAEQSLQRFRLTARVGCERRSFLGPHLLVGVRRLLRSSSQDDAVQDRRPGDARNFDHAPDRSETRRDSAERPLPPERQGCRD